MIETPFQIIYCAKKKRLIYYARSADITFWEHHWRKYLSPKIYRRAKQGRLGMFERIFTKWLPRQGKILEAGCGLGHLVLALRTRGYDVEGIEWAEEVVCTVKTFFPDLPIRVGNVLKLDVPDGYYTGYISLGVMEHHELGPEPYLKEAYRVLRPGGVLIASVPHFHALRRLKARLGFYQGDTAGLKFYQYAFTPQEFCAVVEDNGFEVLETFTYDPYKGIKDEIHIRLIKRLLEQRLIARCLARLFNMLPYIKSTCLG